MNAAEIIKQGLEQVELQGKALCIHASLRSFEQKVDARLLLDTLLELDCTVLAPTFSYGYESGPPAGGSPLQNGLDRFHWEPGENGIFSRDENVISRRDMGALPATLLTYPDRLRGNHPVDSFSAIGPLARQLIEKQTPEDVYGPLRELTRRGGALLMLGTDLTSLTFIHYAEQEALKIILEGSLARWYLYVEEWEEDA